MNAEPTIKLNILYGTVELPPIRFRVIEKRLPRRWWQRPKSDFLIKTDYGTMSGFDTRNQVEDAVMLMMSVGRYERLPDEIREGK